MSGENKIIGAPDAWAERPPFATFSARAVRGILWGAELTVSKISYKSMIYNENWWSRGGSNS